MPALDQFDLADLALALEDHSEDHCWWLDVSDGSVEPFPEDPAVDGATSSLVPVDPLPPAVGYGDMEDFVARVRDPRARDLLDRAIVGRGAFRRFKDALLDFPELRRAWFAFHDARGERRAIEWLLEHGLTDRAAADAAVGRCADPDADLLPGLIDGHGLARRATRDLRRLYRHRLRGVLLIGAWARGDAHPESPVELLVVLDDYGDRWTEKRRVERIAWRHSVRNDTVVVLLPTRESELDDPAQPALARARIEGVRVA